MKPGPVDLARLRRRPHRTKPYLGIYKPTVALACQVNDGSIDIEEYEITYNNVTEGSYGLVIAGMTIYIGSNPGGKDRGKLRVRSITDTVITVAENSDINWEDDLYLTIVRFFEPWGVYPRIVLDADNIPTFYKDYDIAYTNQNQVFDPVVNMGPHFAAFRETGTVDIDYSSSGTFDPADESVPSGTAWWFEGAAVTGSGEAHPQDVSYPNSGHFTTHLTVTSDQGKTFTGRRHVMIFDRPGSGDNPPIIGWGLIGIEGSRGAMGYTARMFVREQADFDKVVDGALVVLFTEDWYGDEKVSIGGDAYDRANILFVGYVEGESIRYNYTTSRLEFRVSSLAVLADLKSTFSAALDDTASPLNWHEMANMTVDRGVVHFLRWHSTLLSIADFSWSGNSWPVEYIDFGRGPISAEVNDLYESSLGASLVTDRQGKMWGEIDVNLTPTGSRAAFAENMELEKQDWLGELNFDREFMRRVSYLEAGGIAYNGAVTGTWEPYLSGAPGEAPSYEGSVVRRTGLVLESQAQLNQFTGLDFVRRNMVYPRIDITLAGDYRNFDIAPQEFVSLSINEEDTYRRLVWRQKRFIPEAISIQYDPKQEVLRYSMTVHEEMWAEPGIFIEIPIEPPYSNPDLPEYELPDFPPIEIPDPWIPPVGHPPSTGNLVYYYLGSTLVRTRNFWDDDPDWELIGTTGTAGDGQAFQLDPFDPLNGAMLMTNLGSGADDDIGPYIYRTTNLNSANPTWTEVWGKAENLANLPHVQRRCYDIKPSILRQGEWYLACREKALGATPSNRPMRTSDYGGSWTQIWSGIPGPGNAADSDITPSKGDSYGGGVVWMKTGGTDIWRSINRGGSWVARADADQAGGQIYTMYDLDSLNYAVTGDEHPPPADAFEVWITTNGASSWIEITPTFDGSKWGLVRHDNAAAQRSHKFFSFPGSGNWYAFLRRQNHTQYMFASRGGIGGNWAVRHQFLGGIRAVDMNLGNELQFYARGSDDDFQIMGSLDGGFNWLDKVGDLASVIGANPNIFGGTAVQVVWSV